MDSAVTIHMNESAELLSCVEYLQLNNTHFTMYIYQWNKLIIASPHINMICTLGIPKTFVLTVKHLRTRFVVK